MYSPERVGVIALGGTARFQRAALVGDRLAVRESVQTLATQLGIQRDLLIRAYIIETVPRLGLGHVEQVALARAGRGVQEELFFKVAQLQEASRDFGRRYGEPPNQIVSTAVPSAHRAIVH